MQLTDSHLDAVPEEILARYEWAEVRNAAAVLSATNPDRWDEILTVLASFYLEARDILLPGGNEGTIAKKLNASFRRFGWREARLDTELNHTLVLFPYRPAGERHTRTIDSTAAFEGYKADWVLGRVAGDVEWNAKDGNLDRDVGSYRSLYETGFIDAAVLITRTQEDLRELELELVREFQETPSESAATGLKTTQAMVGKIATRLGNTDALRLATTTTTNLPKLVHRLQRGDGGGCPILAIAISTATWDGSRVAS